MESENADRIAIAYIGRTKGVHGHVKAQLLSTDLRRFDVIKSVVVQKQGLPDCTLQLEHWKPEEPGILLKFVGIDTPEDARKALVKGYVTIARADVPPLPSGTYYIFELVGSRVEDEKGDEVGQIDEVLEMPSADVYVVRGDRGEILIPAVADYIVEVDIAEHRVVVRGIEELLA
ncbi:MAG: 16S rRNA processing protein RimM [Candidatus Latescibacterota bacterium]